MREAIVTADPDTDEFMDNIKSILTTSKITIFTPKGDMHSFPQGATALILHMLFMKTLGIEQFLPK